MITNITDITKYIQTANTFRTVVNNMTFKWSFRWELGVTRQSAPKVQNHTINTHTRYIYIYSRINYTPKTSRKRRLSCQRDRQFLKIKFLKTYIFHGSDIHNYVYYEQTALVHSYELLHVSAIT